jgi:polyhydroxyalkanoate synthesis regulator protein
MQAPANHVRLEIGSRATQIAEHPQNHSARADPILIKRYAGRRLYNAVSSTYVTHHDLANMILDGRRFVVRDADARADITRDTLDRLH